MAEGEQRTNEQSGWTGGSVSTAPAGIGGISTIGSLGTIGASGADILGAGGSGGSANIGNGYMGSGSSANPSAMGSGGAAAKTGAAAGGTSWAPYAQAGASILSTLFTSLLQMENAKEQRKLELQMSLAKAPQERAQNQNQALDRLMQVWGRGA